MVDQPADDDRPRRRVIKDVLQAAGARLIRQAAMIASLAFAARYLDRESIGVWALIYIVVQFGALLSDSGISTYIVRHRTLGRTAFASAFYLAAGLALGVTLLAAAGGIPLAMILGVADWKNHFVVSALAILPTATSGLFQACLRRKRRFDQILFVEMVASGVVMTTAVALLLLGFDVWAFVIATLVGATVAASIGAVLVGIPRPHWSRPRLMQIIDYSIGLIGFSTLNYWARNADQALIGRFLGVGPLGIYAFAYRIMMMPLSQITVTAHTVALPYMAPHQDDHTKLQQAMKIVTTVVGLLVTLPMCWLWLERDFAVTLMLGESWLPVADLLMLFCPLAVLQTLVNPIGLCFHVTGASSKLFQLGLVNTSVMMVGFISGIILGSIREVAACYLVANLLMAPVMVGFGMRLISGSFLQWLRWSLPFLATVAICFGIGRMRQISESSSLNAAETLLLVVFAAAPFYAIAIRRLGSIRLSESIRRKQFVSPDT